eukprot:TRINITY_DN5141_c1_g1_i1.p1 TRINITY_DN5141_c1_g1~~TRINITY_DN5141_c1_g1_i1.p1  ORF type:complete len:373 (-),score=71.13 TRINITY_DN5141_c1_g1_i1:294-1412(-)
MEKTEISVQPCLQQFRIRRVLSKIHRSYRKGHVPYRQRIKQVHLIDDNVSSSPDIEVSSFVQKFTLDILGKSIFNYDFNTMEGKIDQYYESYRNIMHQDKWRLIVMMLPFLDRIESIPAVAKIHQSVKQLDLLFQKVIREHKETEGIDILGNMLKATNSDEKAHLTQDEFNSNLFILFLAGHETTANALGWSFYELAKNQDIQQKLYDEINDNFGDEIPTLKELPKLKYMEAFISEILRRHTPALIVPTRKSIREVKYNNMTIPSGSLIGFNIFNIHHHPAHWEDPFKFDPERWLNQETKRHRYAYLPFSLGPRMCIGNNFSLIEQHLFLARLIQKYRIEPPKQHQLSCRRSQGFNNTPDNIYVSISLRHSS